MDLLFRDVRQVIRDLDQAVERRDPKMMEEAFARLGVAANAASEELARAMNTAADQLDSLVLTWLFHESRVREVLRAEAFMGDVRGQHQRIAERLERLTEPEKQAMADYLVLAERCKAASSNESDLAELERTVTDRERTVEESQEKRKRLEAQLARHEADIGSFDDDMAMIQARLDRLLEDPRFLAIDELREIDERMQAIAGYRRPQGRKSKRK